MVTPSRQKIDLLETSKEFDAQWYRGMNREVDLLKIDPALHYLIYGHRTGRDPGPNFSTTFARQAWRLKDTQEPLIWLSGVKHKTGQIPAPHRGRVLSAAAAVAQTGDHDRAIRLAAQYLPDDLAYTAKILHCNAAVRQCDDAAWLQNLNGYLGHFGVAPVRLASSAGSRFMRLAPSDLKPVTGGPLVSVIMPAWNAAAVIEHAAGSILGQSWRNIELLIVDDRSDDDSWAVIQRIAAQDDRVRAIRNPFNVGPYVSKNIALGLARGEWITGHDADDWALPDRIERHVRAAQNRGLSASVTDMLRMQENGHITHLNGITAFCFDGVARRASISCMFNAEMLRRDLGFWDSVRYGGDSEMIARAQALLGERFGFIHDIGMICLSHAASLTNNAISGVGDVGMSPSRVAYKDTWKHIYVAGMDPALAYLPFPQQTYRHAAPAEMLVPLADVQANLNAHFATTADDGISQYAVSASKKRAVDAVPAAAGSGFEEQTQNDSRRGRSAADGAATSPTEVPPTQSAQRMVASDALTTDPASSLPERLKRFRFRRSDGKPFRILARGDCTSFRSVGLNKDLFPDGVDFIQAQKSPFIMLNEAAEGLSVTHDILRSLSDVSLMPGALSRHYLGQADREILIATDADLIMLDNWADMNFELWRSRQHGWTVWVHPKYLRDPEEFRAHHDKIGRQTLDQSLDQAEHLVATLRKSNPGIPVLILNQHTDYYPKMDIRREYYMLGEKLAKRVPDVWFGGVISRDNLEAADMDSCGPGNTLHFQGQTYRHMLMKALSDGMIDRFDPATEEACEPIGVAADGRPLKQATVEMQATEVDRTAPYGNARSVVRFSADNPEQVSYPIRQVNIPPEDMESLSGYIQTAPNAKPTRWTPVTIEITRGGYGDWERWVNKRYSRVPMKRRSEKAGHVVDQFNPRLHVPDMHEIQHSADVRSGRQMHGTYLKSIDEMGGEPVKYLAPVQPADPTAWVQCFGVFKPLPGHRQGAVTVDRQLICYISVRRIGDILLYSELMGHDLYLADGVMYHAHFHLVQHAMESGDPLFDGLKFIMYGGIGDGGAELWQWKRTAGFVPTQLVTFQCNETGLNRQDRP